MRRIASSTQLFVLLAALFVGFIAAPADASETTRVDVIKVEGAIDAPLLGYLDDALDDAEDAGAVVVLQIDTSGTLDEDGVALAQRVADLSVPVIAWVGPAPARASGAGLLLMYASSLAAVSPGSQTGPLYPIDLSKPDERPAGLRDTMAGWIEARGKATELTWRDRPLTGAEARHREIAQTAALSVPGLLNRIDGRTVATPQGDVQLRTRVATTTQEARAGAVDIRFDNLGPVKRVLHGVASPTMIYVLLVLGLAALAFEITQPGFGFAGFSGVGMTAFAVYGLWVVPVWWPGLALLVGGVALMVIDVRLRRLGPLTGGGIVVFTAGSFLAWGDVAPVIHVAPWLIAGAVAASLLYYGFGLTVAIQSRDRIVNAQMGMIGLVGEARGPLTPEGPVFVKGALWRGRSTGGPIDSGTPVRVRGVDGLVLRVEAESPLDPSASPR
jgi:membrane-bound serine protease (ClpP class)